MIALATRDWPQARPMFNILMYSGLSLPFAAAEAVPAGVSLLFAREAKKLKTSKAGFEVS